MKKIYDWAVNIPFVRRLMKNKTISKLLSYEVVLYVFFGVVTTLVNFGVLWILNKFVGSEPVIRYMLFGVDFQISWGTMLSNFAAWIITILVAFVTNKLYVFESRSWQRAVVTKEFIAFVGARIFSLIVEMILLFIFVDLIGIKVMISKALLAVIVIIMNYFFSKFFIFTKKKD